ncbi:hypothetical protein H0H92_013786 [Tricholoma furcatifolium]|nr:hypothetical protein H0H92_013786 [Tricholoma furcatifolium]
MLWSFVVLLGGLVPFGATSPLSRRWNDVAVKHSWLDVPRGWEYRSPAPEDYKFDMRIALKQHRIDDLIANLWETSDPNHPRYIRFTSLDLPSDEVYRYGQHLTPAEAEALVSPHPDSREAVDAWLQYHGIPSENVAYSTGGGEWVTIRVSVAEAERMLDTKYNVYDHPASSERVVRTMSYSLPRELHPHVGVIAPTTYFGTMRSMRATSFLGPKPDQEEEVVTLSNDATVSSSCASAITLSCLQALYNTAGYTPAAADVNKLGVSGYLEEYANYADLQTFYSRYLTEAVGSNFTTVLINGGLETQSDPGVEANLDIQYTSGLSYPTPNIYYSTGGSPPFQADSFTTTNTNEPYLDFLNAILNSTTIPQTLSTSYGDDEQTVSLLVPEDYATTVCNLYAQLGSIGTTVFFSSGDEGVGGGNCLTNNGSDETLFQPAFPASCPYVTAVGATTKISPEVAASFSGGGFSRYFAQPSYQRSAVSTFLTGLGSTYSGLYNASGRAYPDVSAQGESFRVIIGGSLESVSGTSASSPNTLENGMNADMITQTVAGIFSLLNDYRLAAGKSSLGFINPLIYSNPSSFNDITSGSNAGCSTNGFTAVTGWDPVRDYIFYRGAC